MERLSHTSEGLGSQVLTLEIALDQAIGRFTDATIVLGSASPWMRGGNVGRFSQCELFLTPCSTHFPDHDQPCMDAHTDSELDTFGLLQTGIEVSHRSEDTQTSTYCTLGVVFMGLGIAKVHQETIPEELGDMSIKACE